MKRTKLKDRILPPYTRGEEIFNMVSHISGGGLGIIMGTLCIIKAFLNHDPYQIVSAFIYGVSMVVLYTMSSIYHGLVPVTAKKVFQIIDHCAIFILIAGTYTPIALCNLREYNPFFGWGLFGFVWGCAALGAVFTAIDLKKYAVLSMVCYIGMGWCVVLAAKPAIATIPTAGLVWMLAGGIAYTIGAVLYSLGKKHRYMHSVFHLFVLLGSILQFISVLFYIL